MSRGVFLAAGRRTCSREGCLVREARSLKHRGKGIEPKRRVRYRSVRIELLLREWHNRITESLILAQNERWRRVLSMQVGRYGGPSGALESGERVSNT